MLITGFFFQVDEIALFDQVNCAGFVVFHGGWFAVEKLLEGLHDAC